MLINRSRSVLLSFSVIWLTATIGCGPSSRVATLSDESANGNKTKMILLDESLKPLIERFNADRDKARVVAIVSSTCGACVRGAIAVNESVVKAYPSADVSVFIVWIDILAEDDHAAAQRMTVIFNDPRVRQFHDPNRLVGDAFAKDLLDQPPAWDMYLLYAASPQERWVDYPPKPTDWMHQIGRSTAAPARRRGGRDLVVGLYDAMSDLGFDPVIKSPPSEQKMAAAGRATNELVNAALREAALKDPDQAAPAQCAACAKAGFIGQCATGGFRYVVASLQQFGDDPAVRGVHISGTNSPDGIPLGAVPQAGPVKGEVVVLDVKGMRCPDCPSKLAMSLLFLPGVKRVAVDFDGREARVTIDPPKTTSPKTLIATIKQSGFTATRSAAPGS